MKHAPTVRALAARRLLACLLASLLGLAAAILLLGASGARPVLAAPPARPLLAQVVVTTTIQDAIDAANPGDTVLIPAGSYTESLTLSKSVSLTGVSSATVFVQSIGLKRVITVTGAAINSSVVISGFTIQNGHSPTGGGMRLTSGAQPLLRNLMFRNNTATLGSGGGIYADTGSVLRLVNVSVFSNTSQTGGGGAYAEDAAQITGGRFQGNACNSGSCEGGGLVAGGALAITGAEFLNNTSTSHGGGVYAIDTAALAGGRFQGNECTQVNCLGGGLMTEMTLALSGAVFISNTSLIGGGGAYAATAAVLNGGAFQRNICTQPSCNGGGLMVAGALTLTGTQFISNTSTSHGGGAYAFGPATLTDAVFQANACTEAICTGGGLYTFDTLAAAGTDFIGNTSTYDGGGAYAEGAVTLTAGGLFQGNQCLEDYCYGGGLRTASSLALTGTEFISNTSTSFGGGASAQTQATLVDGRFQGNACTQETCVGGGLWTVGELELTGTEFISNVSEGGGGGVYVVDDVSITNGLFQGNRCTEASCSGGGLLTFGELGLTDTEFISNTATFWGGGANAQGAATLTNGRFQGNTCSTVDCLGGGLYAAASLALTGTEFISNTSQLDGGGAYAVGAATLKDGLFERNACAGSGCVGGGLFVSSTLTLAGSQFLSNTSDSNGGGAYAFGAAALSGGRFQGNRCLNALCYGGGLWTAGTLALSDAQFISNTSGFLGGGAYALGAATLTDGLFQGNQCLFSACSGGGLYAESSLMLTGAEFVGNRSGNGGAGAAAIGTATLNGGRFQVNACTQAGCYGGGFAAYGSLVLTGTEFIGNMAQEGGGGLYHESGNGRVVNALFIGNSAVKGAALSLWSSGSVSIVHTTIASRTLASGAAVYVADGTVVLTNTLVASHTIGLQRASGTLTQNYTLFSGNTANTAGTVGGGTGSLSGSAAFVNPAAGNYHLSPASDAIDAGINAGVNIDFDGDPRPLGGGFDIGYDEALTVFYRLYLPLVRR